MKRDVWTCFFAGVLCLWLFLNVMDLRMPADRIEESVLREQGKADREIIKRDDSDWKRIRIYLNKSQQLNIHIIWIAKGCILLLVLGVIKRAD